MSLSTSSGGSAPDPTDRAREHLCAHLARCPGCPRFGSAGVDPSAVSELWSAWEASGAKLEVVAGPRRAYRNRSRLAVRGRGRAAKVGVFERGTHRVVDIPSCEVHHPLINQVVRALKGALRDSGVTCYGDEAHRGLVRGVQVAVERSSQTAQVVVTCNDREPTSARALLDQLAERLGPTLHSLWWNGHPEKNNRVLGNLWQKLRGADCIVERLGGVEVFFPPGAFGQSNLDLFERLVERAHAWVPSGSRIVELYAGTGSLGLGLAARARDLVLNELNPHGISGLRRGISALGAPERARVRVVEGPAALASTEVARDRVVIVDPPRKGLDAEVLAALCSEPPQRLIYVSCGPQALGAETLALASAGLVLREATFFDLFPHTEHFETLAFFERG